MATQSQPDPQSSLFDRTIEDPDLEALLNELEELRPTIKRIAELRRSLEPKYDALALQKDERVRCGMHIIIGVERSGGGFSVDAWGPKVKPKVLPNA